MKLITFATSEEAEATLKRCDAKSLKPGLFSSTIGLIAITGIGPFATYATLLQLKDDYETIINIGIAGALKRDLELGTIYSIASAHKYLWHPKGPQTNNEHFAPLSLQNSGLKLVTLDFPLHKALEGDYDLVDMEGYAAAYSAKALGKKCQLFKLVSDFCTPESTSQIAKNIKKYSTLIAEFLNNKYIQGPP